MIRTALGQLYTGITTDVERRFLEHQEGKVGAKYLRSKGPLTIVYQQAIGGRSLTTKAEHAVKKLSKARKESLVDRKLGRAELLETLKIANPSET